MDNKLSPDNESVIDIIKSIEHEFTIEKWQYALSIWVNNTDSLELIKWLAKALSRSEPAEYAALLYGINIWQDDDIQRWEIFKESELLGFTTQAGALGLALFMAGGSMSPSAYEAVYAPHESVKKILHGILINQSVTAFDIPSEGALLLFQQWCKSNIKV